MSNKKKISQEMCDYLMKHANEVEKEKELIIKEYYSADAVESMNFDEFINNYIVFIRSTVRNADIKRCSGGECPFVIIGSIVEVQDIDDGEVYKYMITPPYSKNSRFDADNASCLSPLGKALLFKGLGERVNVEIPTGVLHYIVKSIELPEFAISEQRNVKNDLKHICDSGKSVGI